MFSILISISFEKWVPGGKVRTRGRKVDIIHYFDEVYENTAYVLLLL